MTETKHYLRNTRSRQRQARLQSEIDYESDKINKEMDGITGITMKPAELNPENVSGKELYSFQRKRKNAMKEKAESAKHDAQLKLNIKNEIENQSELKIVLRRIEEKQEFYIRSKMHDETKLDSTKYRESTSNSSESEDKTDDEIEYKPSSSDYSEGEEEEEEEEDYDDEIEDNKENNYSYEEEDSNLKKSRYSKPSTKKRELKCFESVENNIINQYNINSTKYFESQTAKIATSNKTLSRLNNAPLKPEQMKKLLANQYHISDEHKKALARLNETYHNAFPMWDFILEQEFSILLYGLGSKRNIILDFQSEMVPDHPSVVINGFFPSLTLKEIIDSIIVELLEMNSIADVNESFDVINKIMRENPDDRLYLFVHNIDGPSLSSDKVQDFLSRLAAIPNIRMIASVDHTNASLLWDNVKRSRFNFFWWDATTFLPYQEETSYESSLFVQHSGILALSSLQNVFQSLTHNAKEIYIMLVKYQLEHDNNRQYQGMSFKQLYQNARAKFLVSSDGALRTQLVEFVDHKLVKLKRNYEGTEYLVIPLKKEILEQFLESEPK